MSKSLLYAAGLSMILLLSGCGGSSSSTSSLDDGDSSGGSSSSTSSLDDGDSSGGSSSSTPSLDDGDSSSNTSTPSDGGTECVTIPRLQKGTIYTTRTKQSAGTVDIKKTIENLTDTLVRYSTVTSGATTGTGTSEETFTIGSNVINISKITSENIVSSISVQTELTFSPPLKTPYDKVCKGDVLQSDYELTTEITTAGYALAPVVTNASVKYTIESVGESKTINLGTYETVRMKREEVGAETTTTWIDTNTGLIIAKEGPNTDHELISHN